MHAGSQSARSTSLVADRDAPGRSLRHAADRFSHRCARNVESARALARGRSRGAGRLKCELGFFLGLNLRRWWRGLWVPIGPFAGPPAFMAVSIFGASVICGAGAGVGAGATGATNGAGCLPGVCAAGLVVEGAVVGWRMLGRGSRLSIFTLLLIFPGLGSAGSARRAARPAPLLCAASQAACVAETFP